ncbi:MAG: hypothetical protein ACLVFA_01810 [Butyricicoccus sp.]
MKFDPSPTAIWKKYERDRDYKRSIGLYDRVRRNEAFYLGRQWEGRRVQSLDPLIFNVLRRCVNCLSMLVSDDVAVRAQPFDGQGRSADRACRACVCIASSVRVSRHSAPAAEKRLCGRRCVLLHAL